MIRRLIILLILFAFAIGGRAYAVRFVPKDDPGQKQETPQKSGDPQKAPEPGRDTSQPPNPPERKEVKHPTEPQRPPVNDRDRFIDENGDGINDKYQRPPEVIKKKKDTRPEKTEHGKQRSR